MSRPNCFQKRYPHAAQTLNDVRPELVPSLVYGHHNSWVSSGWRCWEFESRDGRDRFLEALRQPDCPFVASKRAYSSRSEAT